MERAINTILSTNQEITFYQTAAGIGVLSTDLAELLHGNRSKGNYEDSLLYAIDQTSSQVWGLNPRQQMAFEKMGKLERRGRRKTPVVVSLQALDRLTDYVKYRNSPLIKELRNKIREHITN